MIDKDARYCPCCKCPIKLDCFCKHVLNCSKLSLNTLGESTIVTLPDPALGHKTVMKFENYKNKLKRPFIVYADTECTLNPSGDPKMKNYRRMFQILHVFISFVIMIVGKIN